jgi:N-methylhydantoinase A
MSGAWLGVDVGGTFTDLVLYEPASGQVRTAKTPTTPADPSEGVLRGLELLGYPAASLGRFLHGTTTATNTLLEERGATVSLLTTRGFRDVLEVGRGNRPVLYDLRAGKPTPLVPRRRRYEIDERTAYDGGELVPLDLAGLEPFAEAVRTNGSQAVAICFLHAYRNPDHERLAAARLAELLPGVALSLSSEVVPEFREYERFSTTVLNAYVQPRVAGYLAALSDGLRQRGCQADLAVMTSSGGLIQAERAARLPVNLLLSGPAGGVAAAMALAARDGNRNLITYDMGGTSTDVCLIQDGLPAMTAEAEIGGRPNRTLQVEIHSIGSGGGSIAWVDRGRILQIGPRSAGAEPGPACYGRGGQEPTVTDANVVLGRIGAERALGGAIQLQPELARAAVERLRAEFPELSLEQAAEGIVRVAVAKMVGAIKAVSMSRGHDPRDFTLLAYGGAGPLHANLVAAELELPRVLVPPAPGNFSAFGLLVADLRHNYVQTRLSLTRDTPLEVIRSTLEVLVDQGRRQLAEDGVSAEAMRFERWLGLRYRGQFFELDTPFDPDGATIDGLERAFWALHEQRYGHSVEAATEIVSYRVSAFGRLPKPALAAESTSTLSVSQPRERQAFFDGRWLATAVFGRDSLTPGASIDGPAIVEEAGATTVVLPDYAARVDEAGNLEISPRK